MALHIHCIKLALTCQECQMILHNFFDTNLDELFVCKFDKM